MRCCVYMFLYWFFLFGAKEWGKKNEEKKKSWSVVYVRCVDSFRISVIKDVIRSIKVIIRLTKVILTAHYLVFCFLVEKKNGSMFWHRTKSICVLFVGIWCLYVRKLNDDENISIFLFSAVGIVLPIVILILTIVVSVLLRYKRRRLRRGISYIGKSINVISYSFYYSTTTNQYVNSCTNL
jgi:hypothetical protein